MEWQQTSQLPAHNIHAQIPYLHHTATRIPHIFQTCSVLLQCMDQTKPILIEVSTNKKMRNIHCFMKTPEYFWKWAGDKLWGRFVPCSFWLFLHQNHISIKGGWPQVPTCGFEPEKIIQTQLGTIYGQRNLRNTPIMRNTQIFLSQFSSNQQRVAE